MSHDLLNTLKNTNENFKSLLEKSYDKVYFSEFDGNVTDRVQVNTTENSLSHLEIQKSYIAIKDKITSAETLNLIKKSILDGYERLTQNYIEYYGRINHDLDDNTDKSVLIIIKTFKNRARKIKTSLSRFEVQDSWSVETIKVEFELVLVRILKDLVDSVIGPITSGLTSHPVYFEILEMFNSYLADLGVYTECYKKGDKLSEDDWNSLSPIAINAGECETTDKSLKDVIKTVFSYPYLIGDGVVVREGEVALWKVK